VPTVIDVKAYALGEGEVEIQDPTTSAWLSLGATLDNNVFRVVQEKWRPDLNGVKGSVKGTERIVRERGVLEVTIPELNAARMGLMVPGSIATISPITDKGGGAATTLAAASLVEATTISVASATGIVVGEYLRVDVTAGGLAEYRQVTAVSGTTITLDRPLIRAHASGVAVVESDGDGRTKITGSGTRIPDSAYRNYRLRVDSDLGLYDFIVKNALNISDAAEMAFGRESQAAPRLTLESRYDPANTKLRPWEMYTPGPDA
jgi:hypothetical protein